MAIERVEAFPIDAQVVSSILLPLVVIPTLCRAWPVVFLGACALASDTELVARQPATTRGRAAMQRSNWHQCIQLRDAALAARAASSMRMRFMHGAHIFMGLFFALAVIGRRKRWLPKPPSHIFDSSRCAPGVIGSLCSALNDEPPPELPWNVCVLASDCGRFTSSLLRTGSLLRPSSH
jgi:hypothetical protein